MLKRIILLAGIYVFFISTSAMALTFNSNSGNIYNDGTPTAVLSATADFSLVNGALQIVLTNTGGLAHTNPDVLMGLFFEVDGSSPFIGSGSSATASTLVTTYGTSAGSNVNVGQYWAYKSGLNNVYDKYNAGISGVGLGLFGPNDLILDGGPNGQPGGGDYGIVNGFTASTKVNANKNPYIDNMLTVLLDVDDNFALDNIKNVGFQYGTSLAAPVPEPSTLLLLGGGLVGLTYWRRRKN